jgi:hypothetical protein
MGTPERQLRIVQMGCVLCLLASIRLGLKVQGTTHGSRGVQWVLIGLALLCTVHGFTFQRRIVAPNLSRTRSRRSTPFTRLIAGNIARLAFATSVGLYGLCLSEFGGVAWQVDSLFALGIILLLIWKPGTSPNPQDISRIQRANLKG